MYDEIRRNCPCANIYGGEGSKAPFLLVISEVLMAVTMKITDFGDITPCNYVDFYQSIEGTFYLCIHSRNYTASHPRRQ
jgi:hypothetical protein